MGGRSGKKVRAKGTQPVGKSQKNKAAMRRFYRGVFNVGNVALVDELCAPDFVEHEEFPGLPPGKEGVKVFTTMFRSAFPDLKAEAHDILQDGNKVAARVRFSGTHQGEFMGIPATGKSFDVQVIDIIEFQDGKAVAHWGVMDEMKMMQQLGVIPTE